MNPQALHDVETGGASSPGLPRQKSLVAPNTQQPAGAKPTYRRGSSSHMLAPNARSSLGLSPSTMHRVLAPSARARGSSAAEVPHLAVISTGSVPSLATVGGPSVAKSVAAPLSVDELMAPYYNDAIDLVDDTTEGDDASGEWDDVVERSAWRAALKAERLDGVTLTSGVAASSGTACTAWALHDTLPLMLYAHAADGDEDGGSATLFDKGTKSVVAQFGTPAEAWTADMSGTVIALGGRNGVAMVAKADMVSGDLSEWRPTWQRYELDGPAPVASFDTRVAVDRVVCSPGDKAFAVMENLSLHLWDYNRPSQPLHSVPVWSLGRRTSAASVDPGAGTVCLLGSTDGRLQMLDYRVMARSKLNACVWQVTQAHGGAAAVRDVSWHPYMPNIFASCGLDGAICVWDSRLAKQAVSKVTWAHPIGVACISWSAMHSELLASLGVDGALAVWNFRLGEAQRAVALAPAASMARPLGVGWMGSTVVGGDSGGAYCSAALSAHFLLPLCPPLASLEQEKATRTLLYTRDLPGAFAMVTERVKTLTNAGEYDKALELLQLCYPPAIPTRVEPPTETSMREDFALLAAYLPPRLPVPPAAAASLSVIKKQKLLLHMHQVNAKGLWRDALNLTDKLCSYYRKQGGSDGAAAAADIAPSVLRDTVAMVMRHHHLSGIVMGCKILHAMTEDQYAKNAGLTRLLLTPTVFDGFAGNAAQSTTDLDYILTNQKVGLSQVDFVRDFITRLWGDTPFVRIEKMMRKTEKSLISVSATVNRIYLASLAQTGNYAKLVAAYSTISNSCGGCEFAETTMPELLLNVALPMMDEWAQAVCEEAFSIDKAKSVVALASLILLRAASVMPPRAVKVASKWLFMLVPQVPVGTGAAATLVTVIQETSNILQDDAIKAFLASMSSK